MSVVRNTSGAQAKNVSSNMFQGKPCFTVEMIFDVDPPAEDWKVKKVTLPLDIESHTFGEKMYSLTQEAVSKSGRNVENLKAYIKRDFVDYAFNGDDIDVGGIRLYHDSGNFEREIVPLLKGEFVGKKLIVFPAIDWKDTKWKTESRTTR